MSISQPFEIKLLIKQNSQLCAELQLTKHKYQNILRKYNGLKGWSQNIAKIFDRLIYLKPVNCEQKKGIVWLINRVILLMNSQHHLEPLEIQQMALILQKFDSYISIKISQNHTAPKINQNGNNYFQNFQQLFLSKNTQIQQLKDEIDLLKRRFILLANYNAQVIQSVKDDKQNICYCGGMALSYYNARWQKHLKLIQEKHNQKTNDIQSISIPDNHRDHEIEIQHLLKKNSQLELRLNQMKISVKLTQQNIINSQCYRQLKSECKSLLIYCNSLIQKLKTSKKLLKQAQKQRQKEIKYLLEKITNKNHKPTININQNDNQQNKIQQILTQLLQSIRQIISVDERAYLTVRDSKNLLQQSSQKIQKLQNDLKTIYANNIHTLENMNYRRESYNKIHHMIDELLQSSSSQTYYQLHGLNKSQVYRQWLKFAEYFKSRDQYINNLKDHQNINQDKMQQLERTKNILQQALIDTEDVYLQNKRILDQTETQIQNFGQKIKLLEMEISQQKIVNTLKISDANQKKKIEQKVKFCDQILRKIETQKLKEIQLEQCYQKLTLEQNQALNKLKIDNIDLSNQVNSLKEIKKQMEDQIAHIIETKNRSRLEAQSLNKRIQSLKSNFVNQELQKEINYFRRKVMCGCDKNEASIALTSCPHIICSPCSQNLVKNRNRKCPICNTKFSENQLHKFIWN